MDLVLAVAPALYKKFQLDIAKEIGGLAMIGISPLVAVVNAGQGGVALMAIEGQKAQPYRVGDSVQSGQYLVGLGLRSAQLGPTPKGPATETLTIPVPALPGK